MPLYGMPLFASLLIGCVLSLPLQAQAATCTFDLDPPTAWTDGEPATLDDIAVYQLYFGECETCFSPAPDAVYLSDELSNPAQPRLVYPRCPNRKWWRVIVIDQFGEEGLPSQAVFLKKGGKR